MNSNDILYYAIIINILIIMIIVTKYRLGPAPLRIDITIGLIDILIDISNRYLIYIYIYMPYRYF